MFAAAGAGGFWVGKPVGVVPVAVDAPVVVIGIGEGAGGVGADDVAMADVAVAAGSAGKVVPVAVVCWLGSGGNCETVELVPCGWLYKAVRPVRRLLGKPDVVDNCDRFCGTPPVRSCCAAGAIDNPVPLRRLSRVDVVASALPEAVVSSVVVNRVRLLLSFDIIAPTISFELKFLIVVVTLLMFSLLSIVSLWVLNSGNVKHSSNCSFISLSGW